VVIAHGHIGEESSTKASTRILVFPEATESRVVGKLDLHVTSKGPAHKLFQGLFEARRADSAQIFEYLRPGGRATPRRGGELHQVVSDPTHN
jgi:succinylglutamate desuccinylase